MAIIGGILWPSCMESKYETSSPGQECSTVQEGGAKYDPSTDGRHCGWSGPEGQRCAEAGDSGSLDRDRTPGDGVSHRGCSHGGLKSVF